jgi:Protein of unknown function (DUF1460)
MGWLVVVVLAGVPSWSSLDDAHRAEAMTALRAVPWPQRLVVASQGFLGTPYVLSPLGEGEGHDPDPLVRFDAVDCVTMVEEALALALARDDSQLVPTLSALRYVGATPGWNERNHIMEAQWLPQNVSKGFVRDVTARYGGAATRTVTKVLDAASWQQPAARGLALDVAAQPRGAFALQVVPADGALLALKKAPSGLIVVVVRADRPSLVTRVSHVGVLVQGPHGPLLRHASRSYKKVVDEPFARYLTRNLDFARWTIEGVALFEPLEPSTGPSDAGD